MVNYPPPALVVLPRPAPPLFPPVEVPELEVVVAEVDDDGVELLELVELELLGDEVVDDVVVLELLVVLELVVVEVVLAHSREASCESVLTPCPRLAWSVGLTDEGRFATELPTELTALSTAAQLPVPSAEETLSRPLFRFAA